MKSEAESYRKRTRALGDKKTHQKTYFLDWTSIECEKLAHTKWRKSSMKSFRFTFIDWRERRATFLTIKGV